MTSIRNSVVDSNGIGNVFFSENENGEDDLDFQHNFLSIDQKKICLCSWGEVGNPMVLLLHGLQSHAGLWEQLALDLSSRGYFVVAPDRRGHGFSDWFESYSSFDYVSDLAKIINGITDKKIILVGHCESTILCSLYASCFPDKLESLVLLQFPDLSRKMNSKTKSDLVDLFLNREVYDSHKKHRLFDNPEEATDQLLIDAPFKIPEDMARKVTPRNTKKIKGGVVWRWDPRIFTYRLTFDLLDIDILLNSMKKIETKTTYVYGKDSSLVAASKGNIFDFPLKVLPNADTVLVPGGHYPHMEPVLYREFSDVIVSL